MSLAKIQEPPDKGLILLTGAPGAGKSTFCYQVALNGIAADRPLIFVTTERSPIEVIQLLGEKGMLEAVGLNFVDAFTETVGLTCPQRSNTVCANCADLNSLSIAITRLRDKVAPNGIFLVFDSLTSPYLFSGLEVVKFMRLFLSKFVSEGNSVLALMDEGCGKEEDLGAMMSVVDGILRMEIKENSRIINVVKHPHVEPTTIEVPKAGIGESKIWDRKSWAPEAIEGTSAMMLGRVVQSVTREPDDYVNAFWSNLTFWSGMLWDPMRFPEMVYEVNKKHGASIREAIPLLPWHTRLLLKLFMPKNFSKVRDMKKFMKFGRLWQQERCGIVEYLENVSKTDEHHVIVYENFECCGFEGAGTAMASFLPAGAAGMCKGLEKEEREWNAVETKCIGLGDPYCEFKLVPGEIDELKDTLEKDSSVVGRIHERLMERLSEFLLHGEPLVDRPRLGSDVHVDMVGSIMAIPVLAGERYQMAWRMGGVKSGKEIGECLMDAGLSEDEVIRRVIDFMTYCKVGKVTMDKTIRIEENCESFWTKRYMVKWEEPRCFFTTGFLNGLFSAVKNKHVREIKCIATGAPYCEWEII